MSQRNAILHYLKSGGKLTPLDALRRFGTLRLAARVAEIRDSHHILTTMIDDGEKRYARYSYQGRKS